MVFFANNNMCMVWYSIESTRWNKNSSNSYNRLYIILIGDRTIQERDFGKIQKDRVSDMKK